MYQMSNEWMEKIISIITNGMNNSFLLSNFIWKNIVNLKDSCGGWIKLSVYFSGRMKSLCFGEIMRSHSVIHCIYTNDQWGCCFLPFYVNVHMVQFKHCTNRVTTWQANVLLKMSSKSSPTTTKIPRCCIIQIDCSNATPIKTEFLTSWKRNCSQLWTICCVLISSLSPALFSFSCGPLVVNNLHLSSPH